MTTTVTTNAAEDAASEDEARVKHGYPAAFYDTLDAALIHERLSDRKASIRFGIAERTVRRRRASLRYSGQMPLVTRDDNNR
jgi:hypothetical protein